MKTNSRRGMTLMELILAMSIGVTLLAAVMSVFISIARSSVRMVNYFEMEQATTRGLEQLGRELRMAQAITTSGSPINQITLAIPQPTGSATYSAEYRYNATTGTFERTTAGKSTVLIRDILPGSFSFQRFDLTQQPAVNDYGTNQFQISMTLSPNTHGVVAHTTARVVSSRFVLRNR